MAASVLGGLLLGMGGGALNVLLLIHAVASLDPLRTRRRDVWRGLLVRWLVMLLLLALAIQQSVGMALGVFAGLWLARWWAVYLVTRGKIAWE